MTADTPNLTGVPTLPIAEARENFRSLIDEVSQTGAGYTITRHGKPVAVLIAHDEYESLIETLNILSDDDAMDAIAEAEAETRQADN
ncbi:type II toxin-antitoxin system Phd/YefM family antitoxin [Nocardioides marmorisolisilvae]|nr:type II toxin-antitoxin system Phd/YefM family antitoxin [Nocardioides marmorisolisilvae]